MIHHILVFFVFVATIFVVKVEAQCPNGKLLPKLKAEEEFKKWETSQASFKSLKAEFKQTSFLAALEAEEESEGKLWFLVPGRMKWEYTTPESRFYLLNGNTLTQYEPAQNQALIQDLGKYSLGDLIATLLMGAQGISKRFVLEKICDNIDTYELELRPVDSQSARELVTVKVTISVKTNEVQTVSYQDQSGNLTRLKFTEVQKGLELDEKDVALEIPAGVDINDTRK
jgi:outer membrane lipoprotein carrier protein